MYPCRAFFANATLSVPLLRTRMCGHGLFQPVAQAHHATHRTGAAGYIALLQAIAELPAHHGFHTHGPADVEAVAHVGTGRPAEQHLAEGLVAEVGVALIIRIGQAAAAPAQQAQGGAAAQGPAPGAHPAARAPRSSSPG